MQRIKAGSRKGAKDAKENLSLGLCKEIRAGSRKGAKTQRRTFFGFIKRNKSLKHRVSLGTRGKNLAHHAVCVTKFAKKGNKHGIYENFYC